jgi:probable F420-dependent oxidoreductase
MHIDANLGMVDAVPPIEEIGKLSARAETMGADGIWVSEVYTSPITQAVLAAENTDDAQLILASMVAFPRSPMVTAYTAWDMQRLSGGRFTLGLTSQVKAHVERRFGTAFSPPGPRFRDYIRAVRTIWDAWRTGDPLEYDGEYYSLDFCPPEWRPEPLSEPSVPIYISAVNPYNLKIAGELCDGVHLHVLSTPEYVEESVLPNIATGAEVGDRKADDVSLTDIVFAITGRTDEEREAARRQVRQRIAFYGSTPGYDIIFDAHGWADVCEDLHRLSREDEWGKMTELITDEMLETFAVDAPWDELDEAVEDRYDHVDRVVLYTPPFRGENRWAKLFAD